MKISAHYEAVFAFLLFLVAATAGYIEQKHPNYLSNIQIGTACLVCVVFITSNIIKIYKLWKMK